MVFWGFSSVFPTHMGVNRSMSTQYLADDSLPHAYGGEPKPAGFIGPSQSVFPTHMGVNR